MAAVRSWSLAAMQAAAEAAAQRGGLVGAEDDTLWAGGTGWGARCKLVNDDGHP